MSIKFLTIISCFCLLIISCKSPSESKLNSQYFLSLPDSLKAKYLDSLSWSIENSLPIKAKGFPIPVKGQFHSEGRRFTDSMGDLVKYTEYEFRSDTQIITDYFYVENEPIKIKFYKNNDTEAFSAGYFFYNKGNLISCDTVNLPDSINQFHLLSKARKFLLDFQDKNF